jgi:hypothetical protein
LIGSQSGVFSDTSALQQASHFREYPQNMTMQEIISRCNISEIDFLKIDIEGSEYGLFHYGFEWLEIVEKISMEVHGEFGSVAEIKGLLNSNGFDVWLRDKTGRFVDQLPGTIGYLHARRKKI